MTETQLKLRIFAMIKKEFPEIWCFKTANKFIAGIPDVIGCCKGRFFAVEIKIQSNKPTPLQTWVIKQIIASGGLAQVCYSVAEVRSLLNLIKRGC